ncbi:MAG TPA: D-aminoacyl-tRNA deacylase [Vicinamibacterales bacterium]|nr:D-aminoacyl-tRNA deacylase [Vicinamibacterales bacterium]
MISVVQRVASASVTVDGAVTGRIDRGLVVLVGIARGDGPADLDYTASKVVGLRIFADDEGRMNRSVADVAGALLVVSQFTLLGDARKGRRPAFDAAAPPEEARALYGQLIARFRTTGVPVETGVFQASMSVALVNDGPVTLLLDSRRTF